MIFTQDLSTNEKWDVVDACRRSAYEADGGQAQLRKGSDRRYTVTINGVYIGWIIKTGPVAWKPYMATVNAIDLGVQRLRGDAVEVLLDFTARLGLTR